MRELLWWRASEALVVDAETGSDEAARSVLEHLRAVAMHQPAES